MSSPSQPTAAAAAAAAMPRMIYGTAWKKERTADLVYEAIKAGFRGIDTAAMTTHYDEAGAGEGIRRAIREGIVSREELYIQTKFTPADPSSPYPLHAPIPSQIHASLASSLRNLSTTTQQQQQQQQQATDDVNNLPELPEGYLDAYLLHSPFPHPSQTLQAWSHLQLYLPTSPDPTKRGRILRLGISNAPLDLLQTLHPPPSIVQNPLYGGPRGRWDRGVRSWCASTTSSPAGGEGGAGEEEKVKYQAFWTLTANASIWRPPGGEWFVRDVARGAGVSPAGAWYALLMGSGVVVLNGTTNPERMREDLKVLDKINKWRETEEGKKAWERCWKRLGEVLDGSG
ncbi:hypothetical protein VTJ04DRAFT_9201 [Mycothermus thermophilus]|uniref:uncharacterized protein n=1 Tax=Humicola insolens TaxID=85995 RepID=UPI0037442ABD